MDLKHLIEQNSITLIVHPLYINPLKLSFILAEQNFMPNGSLIVTWQQQYKVNKPGISSLSYDDDFSNTKDTLLIYPNITDMINTVNVVTCNKVYLSYGALSYLTKRNRIIILATEGITYEHITYINEFCPNVPIVRSKFVEVPVKRNYMLYECKMSKRQEDEHIKQVIETGCDCVSYKYKLENIMLPERVLNLMDVNIEFSTKDIVGMYENDKGLELDLLNSASKIKQLLLILTLYKMSSHVVFSTIHDRYGGEFIYELLKLQGYNAYIIYENTDINVANEMISILNYKSEPFILVLTYTSSKLNNINLVDHLHIIDNGYTEHDYLLNLLYSVETLKPNTTFTVHSYVSVYNNKELGTTLNQDAYEYFRDIINKRMVVWNSINTVAAPVVVGKYGILKI